MPIPSAGQPPIDPIPQVEELKPEFDNVSKPRVTKGSQAPTAQEVYHVPDAPQSISRAVFNIHAPEMPILSTASDRPNWAVEAQHWVTTVKRIN